MRAGQGPALTPVPNVLTRLYGLVGEQQTDAALDLLYDAVDQLLHERSFDACSRMLANLDVGRLNVDVMVGALSITLAAKSSLPERPALVERVERQLRQLLPENEIAANLEGLR